MEQKKEKPKLITIRKQLFYILILPFVNFFAIAFISDINYKRVSPDNAFKYGMITLLSSFIVFIPMAFNTFWIADINNETTRDIVTMLLTYISLTLTSLIFVCVQIRILKRYTMD